MTVRPWGKTLVALAASTALLLTGCTGTEGQQKSSTDTGMIDFLNYGDFGGGTTPKANYNPYLDATKLSAADYIYESLMYVETYSCKAIPWLATSYQWSDPKTLVYTIRSGVKWNDGQPFTAKDVEFTFNMLKKFDVLDTQGVWTFLSSVKATGDDKVTFTFKQPGASAFTQVSGVKIVPEHVWSKVADPTTFVNATAPVGTGPMKLKSFNPRQLVVERNPDYWQADKIKVNELRFNKADAGGQVEQLKLSRGEYDTNAMFVQDIKKAYVDRDPKHHHYWYAPGGVISVYMNLTKAPFNDVAFRKALTTAFDDKQVIDKAQLGYVTQASQSGLVVPGQKDWLPQGLADDGRIGYDAAAADKALTEAGYTKDSKGRRLGKDGKPIAFSFKVPGSYVDWVAAADILIKNLEALGIDVRKDTPTPDANNQDRATGNYDMTFGVFGGGCNMYANFADPLNSARTAPIGKKAASNEIRWQDPKTDELLHTLQVSPDEKAQKEAVAGLVDIMMNQVPTIPIWYGAKWFQYDTTKAEGWPNADDPYADGGNGQVVLTHLVPAGS
ncbi:ABC transporter substrate-binding protein [Kribbella sp. NPDC058693]|uniref:ABC transporter substrate-binding protein n=1 Tax=Kribbella sp. NPDC058693 TaxID=3346602 RepID=UPI00364BE9A4